MATYYIQPHVTQFDGSFDQGSACVPTSLANGIGASTGGAKRPSGASIHRLIPRRSETDPSVPGWSIVDADRAMAKYGVGFTKSWNGSSFADIEAKHNAGHYVVIQGDSDIFANSTCSGKFNGDHCIGASPNEKTVNGIEYWWIDDPICKTGRWEKKTTIKAYGTKFAHKVGGWRWGSFDKVVPKTTVTKPAPVVTLKYGGAKLHGSRRIAVATGHKANVRSRPTSTATMAPTRSGGSLNGGPNTLPNRTIVEFWQVTKTGQLLAGSRTWYGDRTGTRWLHSTSF